MQFRCKPARGPAWV